MKKYITYSILVFFLVTSYGFSQDNFSRFETTNTCDIQYPAKSRLIAQQYVLGYAKCNQVYDLYTQAIIDSNTAWDKMQGSESVTNLESLYKSVSNLYNLLSQYQGILFIEKQSGMYGGDFGLQPMIHALIDELTKMKKDIGVKLENAKSEESIKKSRAVNAKMSGNIQNLLSKGVESTDPIKNSSGSVVTGSGSTPSISSQCPMGKIENPKTRKCINEPKKKIIPKKSTK